MSEREEPSIELDTRVERALRVVGRRVHGRMVLVRLPSLSTEVLNEVGARVWELADGSTLREIARVLAEELDAPSERVEQDVRAFVVALIASGALRVSSAR